MAKEHLYKVTVRWTGNQGTGTSAYSAYSRDHIIEGVDKRPIEGSSDPAFRGDLTRYSPEDLLVASLSACHMLWYLHLCAEADIIVISYADDAAGVMEEVEDGSGRFVLVTLRPTVIVEAGADLVRADTLHHEAARKCFIANSVNFRIVLEPTLEVGPIVSL